MEYQTPEFKLTPKQQEVFKLLKIPFTLNAVAVLYKAFPEPMGELLEQTLTSDSWGSYYNEAIRNFTMEMFDCGMIPVEVAYSDRNNFQKLAYILTLLHGSVHTEWREAILNKVASVLVEKFNKLPGRAVTKEERSVHLSKWADRKAILEILEDAPAIESIFRIEGVESYANVALVLKYQAKMSEQGKPYAKVSMVQPVGLKALKVLHGLSTMFSRAQIGYTEPRLIVDHEEFVTTLLSGDVGINHDQCTLKITTPTDINFWYELKVLVTLRELFDL